MHYATIDIAVHTTLVIAITGLNYQSHDPRLRNL